MRRTIDTAKTAAARRMSTWKSGSVIADEATAAAGKGLL
jgi:hypothetical protein